MNRYINVHAVIPSSLINGPGSRMVIFFQGCSHHCPGCFNPETHTTQKSMLYRPVSILEKFISPDIEGITVSGGEPFDQREGLLQLLKAARELYGLTTVVYTGYEFEALKEDAVCRAIFNFTDVLIDGRYDEDRKEPTLLARGSTNQRFHIFSDVYGEEDFNLPAKSEIIIGRDGLVRQTGFSKIGT